MKKNNNISAKAAPANAEVKTTGVKNISAAKQRRKEAIARCRARRTRALLKQGLTPEQIEEVFKNDTRTILCLYTGEHTVEVGTRTVKCGKGKTKEIPNILHGRNAAEHTITEAKLDVLGFGPTYCWIKTTTDKVEEVSATLGPIGRLIVTKHERPAPEKKDKSPSNNNKNVAHAAKIARKKANAENAKKRIAKKSNRHKQRGTHARATNITTLQKRRLERAKKVGKALIKAEDKKAANKAKKTVKQRVGAKQGNLKLAA